MKQIPISDEAYQALANRHGDVAAFVESLAQAPGSPQADEAGAKPKRSFADALREKGLLGAYDDLPEDLSSNPKHLDGFGL